MNSQSTPDATPCRCRHDLNSCTGECLLPGAPPQAFPFPAPADAHRIIFSDGTQWPDDAHCAVCGLLWENHPPVTICRDWTRDNRN